MGGFWDCIFGQMIRDIFNIPDPPPDYDWRKTTYRGIPVSYECQKKDIDKILDWENRHPGSWRP